MSKVSITDSRKPEYTVNQKIKIRSQNITTAAVAAATTKL